MPAAKVKAKLKVKPKAKATAKPKAAGKSKAAGKLKAKSKAVITAIKKTVAVVAPKVPEKAPKPVATVKHVVSAKPAVPAHETVFERLLRLKAERNAQFHQQAEKNHSAHDHRMPANHARYSKFAGPRRRAS